MKRYILVIPLLISIAACEYNLGPSIVNTSTNTNTNTNNNDIHDLVNFAPAANPNAPVPNPTTGGVETPLPLPVNAQGIAVSYANANPTLIAQSCVLVYNEKGWQFIDGLINALKSSDPRWGYMVKTTGQVSGDVIAYRATSDNVGAWGVDVIVDYCGNPHFNWNVIGFDANAQWSGTRF